MYTTSGLLSYLGPRLGTTGASLLVLLTLIVALAAALAFLVAGGTLVASLDPVQVAPFRWLYRG